MWQLIAAQALQAGIGGLLDRESQLARNRALDRSSDIMRSRLDRLVKDRQNIANYRRGEAQQFLNDYAITMDPERSRAIANMYGSGQERFRAEIRENEQLQDQVSGTLANIEAQKQKPKSFLDVATGTLLGAGAGYAQQLGQQQFMEGLKGVYGGSNEISIPKADNYELRG